MYELRRRRGVEWRGRMGSIDARMMGRCDCAVSLRCHNRQLRFIFIIFLISRFLLAEINVRGSLSSLSLSRISPG